MTLNWSLRLGWRKRFCTSLTSNFSKHVICLSLSNEGLIPLLSLWPYVLSFSSRVSTGDPRREPGSWQHSALTAAFCSGSQHIVCAKGAPRNPNSHKKQFSPQNHTCMMWSPALECHCFYRMRLKSSSLITEKCRRKHEGILL